MASPQGHPLALSAVPDSGTPRTKPCAGGMDANAEPDSISPPARVAPMARATGFLFWVMASLLVRAGARVWRDDGTAPGPRGIVPAGCFRATFRPLWRCSKSVARASTAHPGPGLRSEEHTSELQSLMRTSYAVFCL